ncbi:branched-chain amino acid ABC transporter permease (plasmid) [Agrobacterium tumefaciens]|jgi:branched-chain amino acid transport system permease protein|uniref:branched-chain amino acid ABC transporter permease n=1 Tax=Agrobacterium tumefaciens TaxID=358 RepID=UPI001572220C|nr:branched-chain amino acid ABC transporter permease [Agrobacterium tumefaciens]NSZ76962.1 branched-chain amino acid ABC transporter permease [Agrobacterium tumefaciens]NSZ87444.1 branched-chain amino acid ABC transporter permease [Agrobacterium tumefaciens]WCA72662.1 branched-chain amino acid ABC transporter permease [Agrobacterium tumefaciens]
MNTTKTRPLSRHSGRLSRRIAIFILAAAVLAIAPYVVYPVFLMKALCFALFACAFNLLIGYGGLLSFGHAAFFGSAAYLCGYAARDLGLTPELSVLVGTVGAGLLGYVIGAIAIRRHGIYFAMVTLALAQMVYFFAVQAPLTGGENGMQGIPRGFLFGIIDLNNTMAMYAFVVAVFLVGLAVLHRAVESPFGQTLKAIRDNENRAISLGYDSNRYKHLAFVLSAAIAGLAGATKALVFQLASLTDVHWTMSGEVVLMTLIGGLGTTLGPVVGAIIIVAMQTYLAESGSWVTAIQGATFIVCVLMFREGIVGAVWKLRANERLPEPRE